MADIKLKNVRIAEKCDTYTNWTTGNKWANITPAKGEKYIFQITTDAEATASGLPKGSTYTKTGNGTSKLNALPWDNAINSILTRVSSAESDLSSVSGALSSTNALVDKIANATYNQVRNNTDQGSTYYFTLKIKNNTGANFSKFNATGLLKSRGDETYLVNLGFDTVANNTTTVRISVIELTPRHSKLSNLKYKAGGSEVIIYGALLGWSQQVTFDLITANYASANDKIAIDLAVSSTTPPEDASDLQVIGFNSLQNAIDTKVASSTFTEHLSDGKHESLEIADKVSLEVTNGVLKFKFK